MPHVLPLSILPQTPIPVVDVRRIREIQFGIDGLSKKVCEAFVRELTRLENDPGIGAQPSAFVRSPPSTRVILRFRRKDGDEPCILINH